MTAYDDELKRDEAERNDLQKVISDVEAAKLVSTPGTRATLEMVLQGARARLVSLEKDIREAEQKKEEEKRTEANAAALAERETALSAKEKETYNGFLKDDFFTRKDFGKLEEFYAHTWDRLSDRGKDEMSKRIWEGVRRKEYEFTDLPKDVQEKEERQAYRMLNQQIAQRNAPQIDQQDRQDFIRAYQSGNQAEAAKVLNRVSFKNSLFRSDDSAPVTHAAVNADAGAVLASAKANPSVSQTSANFAQTAISPAPPKAPATANDPGKNFDLTGIDLGSLKLADGNMQTPALNVSSGSSVRSR